MWETNEKRREALLVLRAFVRDVAPGARVSWVEVEEETGLPMRLPKERDLFRDAMRMEKRVYKAIPGSGVEFSSADNCGTG